MFETGSFNLTDDAAILTTPPGQQIVITTDSVIAGIHVLPGATPQQFARKLVRRNLSDLAAMGATPWRYTLNIHTPCELADDWFTEFAATLREEQTLFGMVLIGGDSTSGAASIHTTMTCVGVIEGTPLRRNAAQVGDDIYVSGTLGDAAYALNLLQQNLPVDAALAARYHAPSPRLALGKMLHGIASSAIDISDGLLADIAHICSASRCGATIEHTALPLSPWQENSALDNATKISFALSGGDDYELCFTVPPAQRVALKKLSAALDLPLTRIGCITAGNKVKMTDAGGNILPVTATGWEYN